MPVSVEAQTAPPSEAADFDLGAVNGKTLRGAGRPALRSQSMDVETEPAKPDKTKLRLTYQPDDEGPRFEIGTLGSRKGAMKSRLLHVAMDWNF
ncbi:hypothetical protein [Novosphingobium sp. AP12]|uniref:hypothetical protein n=1 Tax=Novosphingobium sp. AP12 TaxID=1144305 RepID=UPI000271EBE3|nr:hypothetical protein [Novosphingobium sp. AP12]EJL35300.1 hypothetical protein PMI02_00132 [Novosphingobium sp. AP12]